MVDGKDSSMPLRVRLNMLRRYSRAWHTMSAPFERGKDAIYPLSSHIHSMPAPLFLPSGWLSIVDVDLGLLFVRTPALSIPNGPRTDLAWHVAGQLKPSLLPSYVAYRFDPSQDLLILMSDSQDGRHPCVQFPNPVLDVCADVMAHIETYTCDRCRLACSIRVPRKQC